MTLNFKATTTPPLLGLTLDLQGDNGGLKITVTDLKPFTIKLERADGGFKAIPDDLVLAAMGWITDSVPGFVHGLIVGKSKKIIDRLAYDYHDDGGETITLVATDLKFGTQEGFVLVTGNVSVE